MDSKGGPAAYAFSSFFFSLRARPPCRRSRPLIDFVNDVVDGPGEDGANEYKDCGALGSKGLELLEAEDRGRVWSSILSFSLFFWRDKK